MVRSYNFRTGINRIARSPKKQKSVTFFNKKKGQLTMQQITYAIIAVVIIVLVIGIATGKFRDLAVSWGLIKNSTVDKPIECLNNCGSYCLTSQGGSEAECNKHTECSGCWEALKKYTAN